MTTITRPDIVKSVVSYLTSDAEISALVSSAGGWETGGSGARVSASLQSKWKMPAHAVIVRAAGGPPGNTAVNILRSRLDVFCYGSTLYEAMRLWRVVDPRLDPGPENRASFKAGDCLVYAVAKESMPSTEIEPDSLFPRVACSYIANWSGLPL